MKFTIYTNPDYDLKAVPQGFNIYAFMLHIVWFLSKRMYLVTIFIILFCVSILYIGVIFKSTLFLVPIFIGWFTLGFYANIFWEQHLVNKCYKKVAVVDATNSFEAIEKFKNH